ncbi:sugar phosphate isomerase/epimerase [Sporosarcina sp. YIM B06819]|uniref:sugar phosphate isomerase/epimerase family protein n=1 Tax=Sporosarcina sp. YIM B06819 TaxID=3081769 RepID=UPI00298D3574|nr:sugar phosphate isomerase/epimerase [Sporosarcina sp. YIM B06819]
MDNIGLQLYSIKDSSEKDLLGTLEKVAKMGYNGAQFAGFFNLDAADVKAKMDSVGIKAAGSHVQIEQLQHRLDETLKYHEIIENDLIIVSSLPKEMRTTADDYKRSAAILDKIGGNLYARGFKLAYHNHGFEFESFDGTTGFDILFGNTTSDHLKMELDCFWAAYAGHNPIEIIEKYADNCVSLHIKDMIVKDNQYISTELGTGTLPLADFVRKGNEVGALWLVVEQEEFTKDPLDSAEVNVKEIRRLLK